MPKYDTNYTVDFQTAQQTKMEKPGVMDVTDKNYRANSSTMDTGFTGSKDDLINPVPSNWDINFKQDV